MHLGIQIPVIPGHEATMATLDKIQSVESTDDKFVQANTLSFTLPNVTQPNHDAPHIESKESKAPKGENRRKYTGEYLKGSMKGHDRQTTVSSLSAPEVVYESSNLNHSSSPMAPHLAVYDKLLNDLEMRRQRYVQQPFGPRNSLPALPKRPVRKKWGLSAPYSAFYQEKTDSKYIRADINDYNLYNNNQYKTVYNVPKPTPREHHNDTRDTIDTKPRKRELLKHSFSEPSRLVSYNAPSTARSQEMPFLNICNHPVSILSKSFTQWGSGFRAPTRNEYYEDELKRQRVLTSMIHASEPNLFRSTPNNPVAPSTANATPSQNYSKNTEDQKHFLSICHSASFKKRASPPTQINRIFPKNKVKQHLKPSRQDTEIIKVSHKQTRQNGRLKAS